MATRASRPAKDAQLPGRNRQQSRDRLQKRGLARPVGPNQGETSTNAYVMRETLDSQRFGARVAQSEPPCSDGGRTGGRLGMLMAVGE